MKRNKRCSRRILLDIVMMLNCTTFDLGEYLEIKRQQIDWWHSWDAIPQKYEAWIIEFIEKQIDLNKLQAKEAKQCLRKYKSFNS